ncbi:MAG: bifunctional 5,10-methylenetetrahydrofolate dehydrogenase/5,10-methenyltetrahydrofolate cyclohydrolase [Patescibacteria group bacterium]|nr:bifunctional 5,10-methylenetetrahydrofolate dehydrogenase/5,10-methenyltetrahydrofolate cyclohydrolase [Patescibacteria group bacterium]MDE2172541.1 bifunctional 5,10-methylenetetrahydrofolate dehydrogenase/5,10-methenyltetrahydrofolate cyclohydrolase [Patescibacteria group bacterium]
MNAHIIDGRALRDALMPTLAERVKALSRPPVLAIIQAGDRPDSTAFIKAKKSCAAKIGVAVKHIHVSETISQADLRTVIEACNADEAIHGLIVQLPLPPGIDRTAMIEAIDPRKDVDALTSRRVKEWLEGKRGAIMPATARGIRTLLAQNGIPLSGAKAAVIGRSMLVGKPIMAMCLAENATVTVCHSQTPDLSRITAAADIVIAAAGKPGLVGKEHVRTGQTIIDVGINTVLGDKLDDEIEGRKLVGDVDFEAVRNIVAAITPVPGGVGPMTVVSLFENLLDLYL